MNTVPDIYFRPEYGKLYERHEGGKLETFEHVTGGGRIYHQFIRRPLDAFDGFGDWSDIITPYGYGGPICLGIPDEDKPSAVAAFSAAFNEYCRDTKTVSAFIRFHPILNNADDFKGAFDRVEPIRSTIAIDLSTDIMYEEFDTSLRRVYRNADIKGITIEHDKNFDTMPYFEKLYYELMTRKAASDFYFFPDDYFTAIQSLGDNVELVNAVYNGEIISSVMFLKYGEFIHMHFSASSLTGYKLHGAEILKVTRTLEAKEQGYKWAHLGGGVTNDPNDSLFRFKRRFSNGPAFTYYIGKSIYDTRAYNALCTQNDQRRPSTDDDFFPQYRAR